MSPRPENTDLSQPALPTASTATAWRTLGRTLRPQKWQIIWASLITLASSAAAMLPSFAIGILVDALGSNDPYPTVARCLLAIAASLACGAALAWYARVLYAKIAEPAVATLREDAVDHALNLESGILERAGDGELVSRVSDDSRLISQAVAWLLPAFLSAITLLVLSVPGLFTLHWVLGLSGMIAIPMYWLSLRWYLPRSAPLYREEREIMARRTNTFLNAFHGRVMLHSQGWAHAQVDALERASFDSRSVADRVFRMLTRYFARNNRAEFITMAALLTAGFFLVRADATSVGAVTTAALLYHRLFDPISEVVTLFDMVQEAGIALRRVTGVLLAKRRKPRRTLSVPSELSSSRGLVLRGVSHHFESGAAVLSGLDLFLADGQCVALVGTTGAGKSTVARILSGIIEPTGGVAVLDGKQLISYEMTSLRENVALISQDAHVFSGTVRDNLTLGAPAPCSEVQLQEAIGTCHAQWINDLPQGLDSMLGSNGHQLTSHQQQHLALVRIAVLNPRIVIMDEATAEAGSRNSRELDKAANALTKDRTTLIIAHRLSQARSADRIIVMDHGEIIEDGTHWQLLAANGKYAKLWRAWEG
ncbi:ABC transporter ATP-binding protein [Glutamicibacter halophytocola]|uniref:ABC transporter ATP-binding protein/permease n=1 Tax=Glutamicibacter halophytocola TaxID=1933880 RepID=A0AA95BTJ0_9MICC|nr:ABC transporter ATP-binding protein [Glutamicibacter halophytocola]UUX60312.1 ABC transporter ATP-binding protein/permease [Glutamicibacter halophytocola]